jgi:hypothetical protein
MVAEFDMNLIENILWLDDRARLALVTPGSGRGARKLGQRAVIIGAGMSGLAAAGASAGNRNAIWKDKQAAHGYEHRRHGYLRIAR